MPALDAANQSMMNITTLNTTEEPSTSEDPTESYWFYLQAVCLTLVTLLTIIGNLLVMIAILKTKTLRSTQYIFIFCLASTDLSLGVLVLPFGTYYELMKTWPFGAVLCNIWVSLDVMLCSASVLHLLAITIDRILAIKYAIEYHFVVTKPRIALCMLFVWVISIGNSFLPLFLGWNTADGSVQNTVDPENCHYDMGNRWYCLIVGLVTFIFPLLFMALMYANILHMARVQTKKIREQTVCLGLKNMNGRGSAEAKYSNQLTVPGGLSECSSTDATPVRLQNTNVKRGSVAIQKIMTNFDTIYRENKATVTVFVIFGLFFICWFPYMLIYTFFPLTGHGLDDVNADVLKFFTWTGYVNSTVNPILYTMLNTTFRDAMKKLFSCNRGRGKAENILLDLQVANGHPSNI